MFSVIIGMLCAYVGACMHVCLFFFLFFFVGVEISISWIIVLNKFAFQVTMTDTLGKLYIAHTSGDLTEKESAGTTRIQPTLPKRDVQTLCQVCVCVCAMLLLTCF